MIFCIQAEKYVIEDKTIESKNSINYNIVYREICFNAIFCANTVKDKFPADVFV